MRPNTVKALLLLALASAPALAQTSPPTSPPTPPPAPTTAAAASQKPVPKPAAKPAKPKPPAPKNQAPKTPAPKSPAPRSPAPKPRPPAPKPPPAPPPAPQPEVPPPEPTKGSVTGSPLPRFAALRTDTVNMRAGPGDRYPITWVYKRRDLPVLIEREFEVWRLVEDSEGTKGWVHSATLVGRRFAVTKDNPAQAEIPLRGDPKDPAPPVARLQPGVVIRLRSCDAGSDWCQAQVQDYRGWVKRTEIWGVLPGEVIP